MADKIRMAEAIEQFVLFRKASQKAKATLKNDRMVLRRLFLVTGDIQLASLTERHVNQAIATAAETRSGDSLHIDHAVLKQFFDWAVRNRYISQLDNPMHGRKSPKGMPVERMRLPVRDFGRLLDAAEGYHLRDRMVVALGLYLFLRQSEIADLRISDVLPRLDHQEISVRIFKTKQIDVMPVCSELEQELRRWLTWYAEHYGPLQPDWFLVPAKQRMTGWYNPETRKLEPRQSAEERILPTRRLAQAERVVKRALAAIGYQVRAEDGTSLREGVHTLRRSGARALFDQMRDSGYDGAIRHVQAMLHHSSLANTEHYLGLTLDRVKRNEVTKGRPMFDPGTNVVPLRAEGTGWARSG